ncbi:MAG: transporter, family, inner rane transport protein [Pseudonocardiales bacterium]|nr:transporter, family, inner rane transport protein [Pseudonocardiales bacterium]
MYHCRPDVAPGAPDTAPACSGRRSSLSLGALFLASFVVGTAELMMVGVLPLVADDLGVPIGSTGALVSTYALGIAVGGPLLTFATMRLPRRLMLRASFAAYVAGNLLAALAAGFGLLIVARVLTGTLHGLFVGIALGVAPALVTPERTGRAVSMIVGGVSVATALGVPLGTYVGQTLGWRASFFGVVGLGAVALAAVFWFVPSTQMTGSTNLRFQVRYALAPRVLAVLAAGLLVMTGQFVALTFLSPFLAEVTGIASGTIALYLLIYGVATALGTLLVGGRAADRNADAAFLVGTAILVASFALLYIGGASPVLVAVGLFGWGLAGFAIVPSFQTRAVSLAGPGRDLAATLPPSALTAGVALGAVIAEWSIAAFGLRAPMFIAGVTCLVVIPLFYATTFLKAPEADGAGEEREPARAPEPAPAEQQ